ncbi:MAG TPA: peroxidase [Dehalococcoidia bacterium]|nr:peroxidase [Dehalococcoidia bacterium]
MYIKSVPEDEAGDKVKAMYEADMQSDGYIHNYTRAFSLHPEVMDAWVTLSKAIRSTMPLRRYELATLAAARAIRSSYCMLAHGSVLMEKFFEPGTVAAMANDFRTAGLEPTEVEVMAYAEKVALRANEVTEQDVQRLRDHGLTDSEIFDIAATAAARCFFSKTLDAVGVTADEKFEELGPELVQALAVGRQIR